MNNDQEEFRRNHPAGGCLVPEGLMDMPFMAASKVFMAPKQIDCRDYMTPCEMQGNKPWCAAYAAANWAEAMLWRRDDTFDHIKPDGIYAFAKQHDGMPNVDGTTLNAALEALRGSVFDAEKCQVRIVRRSRLSLKYAIHKFGAILAGFMISPEWYNCTRENCLITGVGDECLGGHAVIVCGYDREGVHVYNSWGAGWGNYGFCKLDWATFDHQFQYGAVLSNVLDGLTV